jgi:RNA-directed DNA polymerase
MKESYGEGLATHTGPESCTDTREGGRETLTGGRTGQVFSRERMTLRSADAVRRSGRPHSVRRQGQARRGSARSETPSMCGHTSRENRESLGSSVADGATGRVGKSADTRRR